MTQLEVMLPLHTDIRGAYACGQDQEQNFIQNLALFLCTFLKEHGTLAEKSVPLLRNALHYLVLISEVEEVEIFKICLEYWNNLASELYKESPYNVGSQLMFSNMNRRNLYQEVGRAIRLILVCCLSFCNEF